MANSDSGRAGTDGAARKPLADWCRLEARHGKLRPGESCSNCGGVARPGGAARRGKSAQPPARGKSARRGKSAQPPDTAVQVQPLCAEDWQAFETLWLRALAGAGAVPREALVSEDDSAPLARGLVAEAAAVADWLGADISPDDARETAVAKWGAVIAEAAKHRRTRTAEIIANDALRRMFENIPRKEIEEAAEPGPALAAAVRAAIEEAAEPGPSFGAALRSAFPDPADPWPSLEFALRSAPELVLHICAREVWAKLCEGYRNRPKSKLRAARGKNGHVLVRNSAASAGLTLAQAGAQFPIAPGGALTIDGHAFRKDNAVACVIPPWEQRKILESSPLQLSLSSGAGGPDRLQNPLSIQVESAMSLRGMDGRLARRVTLAVFILDALASAARTPGLVVPADIARALWPAAPRLEKSHYRKLTTILGILRGLDCYVPEFNSRGKRVWREWRLFSTLSPAKGEATGLLDPHSPIYVATEESVLRAGGGSALFDLTGAAQLSTALAQRLYLLGALAVNVQGGVLRKDSAGRWQVNSAAHWECDFDELALRLGVDGSRREAPRRLRRALEIVCGGEAPMLAAKSGLHGEVSLGAGPLLLEAYAGRCAEGRYDRLPPDGAARREPAG